jgi:hypothetical protein
MHDQLRTDFLFVPLSDVIRWLPDKVARYVRAFPSNSKL